ncbi:amino acid permease 6 isoform X2 [Manihot esculenta]|uniref:amino acid permease 6 isoform X2 n=1 Tax=Manihot esculenta TaxID=3983 RepID=UPI001CC4F797|nr:amino acid permease 6 isoform X2 [Manihot esculenta]
MAKEMQHSSMHLEQADLEGNEHGTGTHKNLDDDGRPKRTGTWVTASAHIITAVIGSGVLSLAWAIAQLGWVAGPVILMAFSCITFFTSTLLADSYRSPDPVTGRRNYTYMDAVRANLGGRKVQLCGLAQYVNLIGITIGYTITASISMVAVKRSNCFHKHGHHVKCNISNYPYMIIFACIQIILSQIPNFHKLSWLSVLAAVMSFAYSSIGLGLSIAKVAGGGHARTSLTGTAVGVDVTPAQKDTIKSSPPENKAMKRASFVGILITTLFYVLCGSVGYAAFGDDAPGNFLTGFGFYEPFWLIDFANVCIAVHLIGAYQVFSQPVFSFVEKNCHQKWPETKFITREHAINIPFFGVYYLNSFRLVWRTVYVIVTAVVAMIFPFFNDFLGLIGAASFWPLTVYFPVEMYIARTRMRKFSLPWTWLNILSFACLIVSLVAAAGSIEGLVNSLKKYKPFQSVQ